eukprot:9339300-Alexandrium_andersonii.AAC.1
MSQFGRTWRKRDSERTMNARTPLVSAPRKPQLGDSADPNIVAVSRWTRLWTRPAFCSAV